MDTKGFSAITGAASTFVDGKLSPLRPQEELGAPFTPTKTMFQLPCGHASASKFRANHCCWLAEFTMPFTRQFPKKPPLA